MNGIPWSEWPDRLWGYVIADQLQVSFCIHALVADGLKVGPWDRHRGGSGRLRAAGLTAELWEHWFESVVQEEVRRDAEVVWPAWERSTVWPPTRDALHAVDPPPKSALDLWAGPPEILEELRSIPKPPEPSGTAPLDGAPSPSGHPDPLWDELQRYRGRVPYFWVLVVQYPFMVAQALRPAAIVMSERVVLNPAIYRGTLFSALSDLAQ